MLHAVCKSVKLTLVSVMFRAACMVRSFGCPRQWCQMIAPSPTAMVVADIAGEAVAVAVGSPSVVVAAAKDVVAVKAEAAPMAAPPIRRAP